MGYDYEAWADEDLAYLHKQQQWLEYCNKQQTEIHCKPHTAILSNDLYRNDKSIVSQIKTCERCLEMRNMAICWTMQYNKVIELIKLTERMVYSGKIKARNQGR